MSAQTSCKTAISGGSLRTGKGSKRREVVGVILLASGLFVALALLSFQLGGGRLMGPLGDRCASALYWLVGVGSYLVTAGLFALALRLLVGQPTIRGIAEAAGALAGLASVVVLLHLAGHNLQTRGIAAGGMAGEFLAEVLRAAVSTAGAVLVSCLGLALAIMATTSFEAARVGRAIIASARLLLKAARWLVVSTVSTVGTVVTAILPERSGARTEDDEKGEDDAGSDDDKDDGDGDGDHDEFDVGRGEEVAARRHKDATKHTAGAGAGAAKAAKSRATEKRRPGHPESGGRHDERQPVPISGEIDDKTVPNDMADPTAANGNEAANRRPNSKAAFRVVDGYASSRGRPQATGKSVRDGGGAGAGAGPVTAAASLPTDTAPTLLASAPSDRASSAYDGRESAEYDGRQEPVIVEPAFRKASNRDMKEKEKQAEANRPGFILKEGHYQLPPVSLLKYDDTSVKLDTDCMRELAAKLEGALKDYGIQGNVVAIRPGPVVTMYEYAPAPGTRLNKIASLADDLAMTLEAISVRIVAPIPGKAAVGIEIPNKQRETVFFKEIVAADVFYKGKSKLMLALGKDSEGGPVAVDLA
ncbi:MAG: DNA translocase FtsK 4TM domain-containing protein, partial [Pseudomonadota bacterium]